MTIEEALHFAADKARELGAEQFDFMAGQSRSLGISVFQKCIQNTEISESMGLGVRVFRKGRPGYAFTERISAPAVEQTLRDALSHCEFTDPLPLELPAPQTLPELAEHFEPALENLDLGAMSALALDLEARTLAGSSEISNVPWLGMNRSAGTSWFLNHRGIFDSRRENSFSIGVGAVAMRDGISKMGVYNRSGRQLSWADPAQMAAIVVERSLELLGARPIASGSMPVVFSNRVSGQIISMFQSPFFADNVQKGQSRLAGKIGQIVASPHLHLLCDPFRANLPGSEAMDGEGVVPQRLDILLDGILHTFLHNLESATKDGVRSTGNASRGWSGKVGTGFSNLIVAPGAASEAELLAAHPRCLHVVKLEGGSGCSAVSGEISIGAQGFLVENGQRIHPVDGITLSGNYFDLLHAIESVGNAYNDSYSSVRVPALLVSTMAVSS